MSAKVYTLPHPGVAVRRRAGLATVWRGYATALRQELQSMATLLAALGEEAARCAERDVPQITAGTWTLDIGNLELRGPGQPVAVTFMETKLLQALMEQPGQGVSRAALLRLLVGEGATDLQRRNIDNYILRLRRKLGPAAAHLQSLRGFGFRWNPRPDPEEAAPCPSHD